MLRQKKSDFHNIRRINKITKLITTFVHFMHTLVSNTFRQ